MSDGILLASAALFLAVGALYSSIGHAGSLGYLALMTLLGAESGSMRPAVLVLNTMVAGIASIQFWRAGCFCWRLFWPFGCASIPLAYLGGRAGLAPALLNVLLGAVLMFSALRMARAAGSPAFTETRRPPIPVAMIVGGLIGFLAGLSGTGGSVFLGPCILLFNWADARQAAGASALFSLGNSLAGIAGVAGQSWDPPSALPAWAAGAALGGMLGATFGSRVAAPRTLRLVLCVVLVVAGIKLVSHPAAPVRRSRGPSPVSPELSACTASSSFCTCSAPPCGSAATWSSSG